MHGLEGVRQLVQHVVVGVALCGTLLAAEPESTGWHQRLDAYRDADGAAKPIKSPADWQRRRAQILAGMEEAMGPLPPREDLPEFDLKVLSTSETDTVIRQSITFVPEDGDRLSAILLRPKKTDGQPLPAMLALHPTGAQGKLIVLGEGPRENRQYGLELAERGYVVICPDYPSFGDIADYDFEADDYLSGSMKGIFNHMRCVDLLQSLPEVDGDRIGVIGHSLGGHNAMFVGVFDSRLKVIVSSCGWTPFHDYYNGKIKGWTSSRYMPLLESKYKLDPDQVPFDFYEVVAALAPRPFFSASPLHDSNFEVAGVRKAIPKAREIYQLLGAPEALELSTPDCEHDFPPEVREAAYRFIDAALDHQP